MDRYFSSRVKRLYREKAWSMAEFSRRTTIGRTRLQRLIDTRSGTYVYGWTWADCQKLANAFNVTREYLTDGTELHAPVPTERESQREITRLRIVNDRLRNSRGQHQAEHHSRNTIQRAAERSLERTLLGYATEKKLEIVVRNGKFVVVSEHEYEIAEADNAQRALELALAGDALND